MSVDVATEVYTQLYHSTHTHTGTDLADQENLHPYYLHLQRPTELKDALTEQPLLPPHLLPPKGGADTRSPDVHLLQGEDQDGAPDTD